MSSKKKGIVRGSAEHTARKDALQDRRSFLEWEQRTWGRVAEQQELLVALGRMGFRSRDFYRLQEVLLEMRKEYKADLQQEIVDDKECWHLRAAFDRELFMYVPEVMRVDWDTRFDFGRHTPGMVIGPADNRPEEMSRYISALAAYRAERKMAKHRRELKREQKTVAVVQVSDC